MGTSAEVEKVSEGIVYATAGFGAFSTLMPGAFLRSYRAEPTPDLRELTRMWGVANLGLAASLHGVRTEDERRRALKVAAGVSAGNVLLTVLSRRDSRAGQLMGLVTTGGFLAAAVYALSRD